jgi:ubiquinone/menaquinone biosynthesis C-methylase UbiE
MKDKVDVQKWWAENPMTYGKEHGKRQFRDGDQIVEFDWGNEFFNRADKEFLSWNEPLHGNEGPFSHIFPYDKYCKGAKVLEVGCGLGCMASLWVRNGSSVTAVDLNPVAIEQTKKRFELAGLSGTIQMEDANNLSFGDETFDYVYSWGVLHHSPNLEKSIAELMRVLKTGGGYGIMLYNRRSILHLYMTEFLEGWLHCEKYFLNPLELASRYGDGARAEGNPYTWPITKEEALELLKPYSSNTTVRILGTDLDSIFRIMLPGLGYVLPRSVKKAWARRYGWSLWISGHKI